MLLPFINAVLQLVGFFKVSILRRQLAVTRAPLGFDSGGKTGAVRDGAVVWSCLALPDNPGPAF
jgi:hypothetical protein